MVNNLQRQRGVSLVGLLFVIVVLGIAALVAMKVFPAYLEYQSIEKAVLKARSAGSTIVEVRKSFTASAMIEEISSIDASDLEIIKEESGFVINYAYSRKAPLIGNASLLLDFAGSTKGR